MTNFRTSILVIIAMIFILSCNNQTKEESEINSEEKESTNHESTDGKDAGVFQKSLAFKDISFDVTAKGSGSLTKLIIQPKGFEETNQRVELDIEGKVTDAQVADLNSDGFPELVVFVQSTGSGSYGNVIAYSANRKKSMSHVYFTPPNHNPKIKEGYMGHDKFFITESTLIQEFPIYKDGDANTNPTGGIRRIQYKLVDGEASRKFEVDQISEPRSK